MTKRKRFDPSELERGRRHELEHVDDELFAQIIAEDHLAEDPQYYSHLEACMPQTRGSCPSCRGNPGRRPRRKKEPYRPYRPAQHYTEEELRAADIADLEADLRSAIRDHGDDPAWADYITQTKEKLAVLTSKRNPPRTVRDATTAEKREYLHQNIDELLYPRHVHLNSDVAALHRIAKDTGDLSALRDLLADPSLADDFEWLVPSLMQAMHHQVMAASIGQIDEYTGPFFRVRRGR